MNKPVGVTLLALLCCLGSAVQGATVDCQALLRDAVIDEFGIRAPGARLRQIQAVFCGHGERNGAGILLDEDISALCDTPETDTDAASHEALAAAARLLGGAFADCAAENAGEVSHAVFTTEDPAVFTYQLYYSAPAGTEPIPVESFTIHNARCQPSLDAQTRIMGGRRSLICQREADDMVLIALNTVENQGTSVLEPLRLGAFKAAVDAGAGVGATAAAGGSAAVAIAKTGSTGQRYSRFSAKRRHEQSACNRPSLEVELAETTEVKLIAKATAQGGSIQYPLWIALKVQDETRCERQVWTSRRGSVAEECFIWLEGGRKYRIEAEQGSRDASCTNTELEVWY